MNAQHNWTVEMPEKYYPRGGRFAVWTDGAGRHFFTVDDRSHSLDDWRSTVLVELLRLAAQNAALKATLADEQKRFGYFETKKLQEAWAETAKVKRELVEAIQYAERTSAQIADAEARLGEAEEAIRILASRWPRYDLADGPAKLPAVVRALGRER